MRKTQSKKQSIDFVPKEIVRGQMRSEVWAKIAKTGIHGNFVQQTYTQGIYASQMIGGYQFTINDYLPEGTDVLIGTTMTWGTATDIIAANVDRLVPSSDIGLYLEVAEFDVGVYTELLSAIGTLPPGSKKVATAA
jgi:hypothetical protein